MFLVFNDRESDSPFIERVWHCHSERAGTFLSVASPHCEMVVTRHGGQVTLTLRGPETRATPMDCPADAEWLGIRFKLGTFMPQHPASSLIDGSDVTLPAATKRTFRLDNTEWEFPDFENAETFVKRIARVGMLARDSSVEAVLQGERRSTSLRTAQRHFLAATGMTCTMFRRIERARYAATLLKEGASLADAVHEAGYFDQAHLTRSLRVLIGETPARILRQEKQLSFLYKTGRHL